MAVTGDDDGDLRGDVRGQIREFLTTRRARISPEQAGLPVYGTGRRRVKGLRREEAAMLAGVSVEYYIRLERGTATGISDSVIDGITHALQLNDAERRVPAPMGRPRRADPRQRREPPPPPRRRRPRPGLRQLPPRRRAQPEPSHLHRRARLALARRPEPARQLVSHDRHQ